MLYFKTEDCICIFDLYCTYEYKLYNEMCVFLGVLKEYTITAIQKKFDSEEIAATQNMEVF